MGRCAVSAVVAAARRLLECLCVSVAGSLSFFRPLDRTAPAPATATAKDPSFVAPDFWLCWILRVSRQCLHQLINETARGWTQSNNGRARVSASVSSPSPSRFPLTIPSPKSLSHTAGVDGRRCRCWSRSHCTIDHLRRAWGAAGARGRHRAPRARPPRVPECPQRRWRRSG